MLNKIVEYIKHPIKILLFLDYHKIITLTDKTHIKLSYKLYMHKRLNLENPQTLNEKIEWLKLNDRKDIYTLMVDKYEAKKYVSSIIGEEYIIPTIGVYDTFDEIDFSLLPDKFVMKATQSSGDVFICQDKNKINKKKLKRLCQKWLKRDYYRLWREWPYKNVKPRILIEKYMEDNCSKDLFDYKLHCFNGKIDNILVCIDRFSDTGVKYYYFDKNWNHLPYSLYESTDQCNVNIDKPKKLNEMIMISEKLSNNIPQLRVDLYYINNKIYFGELTFSSNGGMDTTITENADNILGSRIKLNINGDNSL